MYFTDVGILFSKGFVVLECDSNKLEIIANEEKQINHAT